ncbi:MAG TPA: sugar ABC transporter substrate-binding protein [Candidatus Hydrogenedentes bacterium]|nr:sugar ABC transporter substrate-binding protein [Candidatus Hydrogenedentota bacterium]
MNHFRVFFCALLTGVLLAGCGAGPGEAVPEKGPAIEKESLEIAVIPKGLTHQFWLSVKAGAEAAAEEFGATIIWQGPSKETEIAQQINIVQDMITRGVDGIVLAACDANALINVVEQAHHAGIPVVMVDSDVNSDIPKSLVATDNVQGGAMAVEVLSELIGGEGDVGLLPFVPGAATSELREQGFREALPNFPNLRLVAVNYSQSDAATGMNVTSDMLTAHPNLAGIFAANEPGAIGSAQALRTAGKAGEVKLVAFDASGEQLTALKDGVIQALIVQNPFRMGYESVKSVVDALEGRPVPKRIDTGVTVITLENLDQPEIQALLSGEK